MWRGFGINALMELMQHSKQSTSTEWVCLRVLSCNRCNRLQKLQQNRAGK